MLKTVENLGVSYVKTSDPYHKKLYAELTNLNFPHKTEAVSIQSIISSIRFFYFIQAAWSFILIGDTQNVQVWALSL